MTQDRFVAYYRVSTDRQGRSGLGLEAQREAVHRHTSPTGWPPLAEFTEVETGKGSNALAKRPQLQAALAEAKRLKATLVIAKLDRLARNVHFISGLIETGVPFVAADIPNATTLMLHIYAAVAEEEARATSVRTKAALQAAKARGVVLGANGKVLAAKHKADAEARLEPLSDRLLALRAEGLSVRRLAAQLNAEGVPSPGGGTWRPSNLHKALQRLEPAQADGRVL